MGKSEPGKVQPSFLFHKQGAKSTKKEERDWRVQKILLAKMKRILSWALKPV